MPKRAVIAVVLLLMTSSIAVSQEAFTEYQVMPNGGKLQFEQVVETQLELSDLLFTKYFDEQVKVNFDIDSAGCATNLVMDGTTNSYLRSEVTRIMRFFRFNPTTMSLSRRQPYYVVFDLSTKDYRRYLKQKTRAKISRPETCDSSMAIQIRADRSPSYYRSDDSGLADYILSEIQYPPAAAERSVEGTVVLEFVVETNGFVTGIDVKRPVGAGCTEEAIRLIRQTRWQPAVIDGKAVRYRMNYPITFSLRTSSHSTVGN